MQQNTEIVIKQGRDNKIDKIKFREYTIKYGALVLLLLLIIINSIMTPNFFKVATMWNILIQVTSIMLVGLGMTVVISSGGIDISVGAMMAIASIVGAKLLWLGVVPAIIIALLVAGCFGLFSGFLIAHFKIQPMIVTLGMMIAGRGIAQVINDAMLLNFTNPQFSSIGQSKLFGVVPIQVFIMAIAIAIIYFVVKRMKFGRYVQSMGDNYKASRLSGINTFVTTLVIYGLCAVFAGAAGLIETARLSAADANAVGKFIELDAIASVAVGGTPLSGGKANIFGTIVGALMMQIITVSVNMNNIPHSYSIVIKSIIIILALYIQRERTA